MVYMCVRNYVRRLTLGLSLLSMLLCLPAWAQRAAELDGNVTDRSGSVVPAAKVTATNTATGVAFTSVTNDAGIYRFVELVAGTYQVEAVKQGFKTYQTSV